MRIVVIASTNGGVLSKLLESVCFKEKLYYVVSDRECGAIKIAEQYGIPCKVFNEKNGRAFSDKLLEFFKEKDVELFVSFYTKILAGNLLKEYKGRLINLHPSILPAFSGMSGFASAVGAGSKIAGTTIHLIDEGVDTGLPILQTAIPLDLQEGIDILRHRIFNHQCISLLQVIKWFDQGRVLIRDDYVEVKGATYVGELFSPSLEIDAIREKLD
jgi:phosphoribosylglycinamide formyltransferase-1